MIRNHNIVFEEVPELNNTNIKIENSNDLIITNDDSNKNIISA